jgi:uncharacterized membrane protein YeaQ/YmgE (transglycosylase-associated protein family)
MEEILITIVIGFVIGIVARFLLPGRDPMGFVITTVVGIAGALLAKYIGESLNWYAQGRFASFAASVLGAMALLLVLRALRGKL